MSLSGAAAVKPAPSCKEKGIPPFGAKIVSLGSSDTPFFLTLVLGFPREKNIYHKNQIKLSALYNVHLWIYVMKLNYETETEEKMVSIVFLLSRIKDQSEKKKISQGDFQTLKHIKRCLYFLKYLRRWVSFENTEIKM